MGLLVCVLVASVVYLAPATHAQPTTHHVSPSDLRGQPQEHRHFVPTRGHVTVPSLYTALNFFGDGGSVVTGTVLRRDTPLLVQDKPWEPRLDNAYPNIDYDAGSKRFQLWYGCCLSSPGQGRPNCDKQVLLYANSTDGLTWEKPNLGLFNLSKLSWLRKDVARYGTQNNVLLNGGGIGVFRDHQEQDPSRRFKASGVGCFSKGGFEDCTKGGTATSADGLTFTNKQDVKFNHPQRYDCHTNVFFDQKVGRYVMTTRTYLDPKPGRCIGVTTGASDGAFGGWNLTVDTVETGSDDYQLYSQVTFPFHDVYLGIVMVYEPKPGFVRCKLTWSRDLKTWAWATRGGLEGDAFIPPGATGSFDAFVCFAAVDPVLLPGETAYRVYYMGGNGPHSGTRNTSMGLATVPLDRFAGVRLTNPLAGSTTTIPAARVVVIDAVLVVSADVGPGGSLRVGVEGLPGLEPGDATPIVGPTNTTRSEIRFANGHTFASQVGNTVDLQFVATGPVTLYTFGFQKESSSRRA
eukprot:m.499403 g.499403  ORF g.499403 m.499403 type:complete len:519 (+) comp57234_c0_seq1:125-1681(+)